MIEVESEDYSIIQSMYTFKNRNPWNENVFFQPLEPCIGISEESKIIPDESITFPDVGEL